ncbi:Protamine P1 family protein [Quillaja saponaria]|uniref:Protamine P1 family protein n=1 Tax=Quillaja saponaria TaxID=32244 RepID=A0AAD7Q8T8_QUISA|nr:Protamine P1 family protein [Quillaja saponaria]
MKLSSKPISSPGRTEKFPPPLMRFLRSNAGSKSRGRSRSSPMFVRKKNTAIETQEPSSPKVTCMGQVRVRRSSKQAAATRGRPRRDRAATRTRCRWIRNTLFCNHMFGKFRPNRCRPVWPKWVSFFRVSSWRKSKIKEDSMNTESKFRDRSEDSEQEENEEEERAKVFVPNASTPPKNALLLTRCRSAPYRSSSLASRFWGSPLRTEETGEDQRTEEENKEHIENEKPTSERESISDQEGRLDPKPMEKLRFFKDLEASIQERMMKSENVEEFEKMEEGGDSVHPLVLTRCKSEPARTGEKLDPTLNFWKNRELGLTDSCSPHVFCD